jgi:hypothetical protein
MWPTESSLARRAPEQGGRGLALEGGGGRGGG